MEKKVEDVLVVSYDIYGNEREIETYLFDKTKMDKKKASDLREEYESTLVEEYQDEQGNWQTVDKKPFELWVQTKGYYCKKVDQIRVEPVESGVNSGYNGYMMELLDWRAY